MSLSPDESTKFECWIEEFWEYKRNYKQINDEFGLIDIIEEFLNNAKKHAVFIDLKQGTNVMKRDDGAYVITDPFN